MKLAVCFFGQPRYFDQWIDFNEELYKDCDVDYYAHFWGDVEIEKDIKTIFNPKRIIVEPQADIPIEFSYKIDTSKITKSVFITLSPLYSMNRLHSLIETVDDDYDYWILTRTDIVGKGMTLKELPLNKNELYTSYVPGDEWLTTHIDNRFICGSKQDILDVTKIYSNLDLYLNEEKMPLCQHRLVFRSIRHRQENMNMLVLDSKDQYGSWFFVRNKVLSST